MTARATGPSSGCYIDLFDRPAHAGKVSRLPGPAVYRALRRTSRSKPTAARSGSANGVAIESLAVGPRAFVLCFSSRDPTLPPTWLEPRESVDRFGADSLNPQIDSFQLFDRPPAKDDPAYDAYRRRRRPRHRS